MARKRVRRTARGGYKLTARRRTALRKAQMASARARRGHGKARAHVSRNRKKYIAGGVVVGAVAVGVARHKISGSKLGGFTTKNVSLIDQIHGTKNPVPLVRGIKVNRSAGHVDASIRLPRGMRGVTAYNHKSIDLSSAGKIMTGVKQSSLLKPIHDRKQIKEASQRKAAWQRDLAAIKLKEQNKAKREYQQKQRRIKASKKRKADADALAKAGGFIAEMV